MPDVPRARSHRLRPRIYTCRYLVHGDKYAATGRRPTPATRRENFIPVQAKHLSDHCRGGHFYQQDVIETNTVKRVFQRDTALNLMSFDHPGQHRFMVNGAFPTATALRDSQSAVAKIPPRLSEG